MTEALAFLDENKELLTLSGILLTLAIFVWQNLRAARIERQENYMKLELASNDLFRFEADNAEVLVPFDELAKPPGVIDPKADRFARSFYFMTLNLFEISIRLRKDKTIAPEVFGSWVAWYYDTLTSWYFREEWPDLRRNYTKEIRAAFDPFVTGFDPAEDEDARRKRFFAHVGKVLKCRIIEEWLN
jgi:hypothetical protein